MLFIRLKTETTVSTKNWEATVEIILLKVILLEECKPQVAREGFPTVGQGLASRFLGPQVPGGISQYGQRPYGAVAIPYLKGFLVIGGRLFGVLETEHLLSDGLHRVRSGFLGFSRHLDG